MVVKVMLVVYQPVKAMQMSWFAIAAIAHWMSPLLISESYNI